MVIIGSATMTSKSQCVLTNLEGFLPHMLMVLKRRNGIMKLITISVMMVGSLQGQALLKSIPVVRLTTAFSIITVLIVSNFT